MEMDSSIDLPNYLARLHFFQLFSFECLDFIRLIGHVPFLASRMMMELSWFGGFRISNCKFIDLKYAPSPTLLLINF